MLLEEDGLIAHRRGSAASSPTRSRTRASGSSNRSSSCSRSPAPRSPSTSSSSALQTATDFVSDHLRLASDAEFWFRESIVRREGVAVALVQEYVPDEDPARHAERTDRARAADGRIRGLDAAAGAHQPGGSRAAPGPCRVAANVAGPTRAGHLGVKATDPLIMLTQTADIDGKPAYVSKIALPPAFGHLDRGGLATFIRAGAGHRIPARHHEVHEAEHDQAEQQRDRDTETRRRAERLGDRAATGERERLAHDQGALQGGQHRGHPAGRRSVGSEGEEGEEQGADTASAQGEPDQHDRHLRRGGEHHRTP